MNIFIVLVALFCLAYGGADRVLIYPGSKTPKTKIKLAPNPNRKISAKKLKPNGNNMKWVLYGQPAGQFPLAINLKGRTYGFAPKKKAQELALTLRGGCRTDECDLFVVFAFGKEKYISFATDLDGGFWSTPRGKTGIQVYPKCGKAVADGDGSKLLNNPNGNLYRLRSKLAGGDYNNWYPLDKNARNYENFPITFELVNNIKRDKFIFRFASKQYPDGLECMYKGAIPPKLDVSVLITPDWDNGSGTEKLAISSLILNGNRYRKYTVEDEEDLVEAEDGYSIGSISEIFATEMDIDDGTNDNPDDWDWDHALTDEEVEALLYEQGNIWTNYAVYGWNIRVLVICIIAILIGYGLYKCYKKWRGDYKSVGDASEQSENRPLMIDVQTKY